MSVLAKLRLGAKAGWVLTLVASLSACGGGSGPAPEPEPAQARYFPLSTGSVWVYTDAVDGAFTVARVKGVQSIAGADATLVEEVDARGVRQSQLLYQIASGGLQQYEVVGNGIGQTIFGPTMLMAEVPQVGDSRVLFDGSLDSTIDIDADGTGDHVVVRTVVEVVGFEPTLTPVGRFDAALHQRTRSAQTYTRSSDGAKVTLDVTVDDWFARDIGRVRRSSRIVSGSESEVLSEELQSYRIGQRKGEMVAPRVGSVTVSTGWPASVEPIFVVVFSEPIDAPSLQGGALRVFDGRGSPVLGLVSVDGKTATFTPGQRLASGTYAVKVDTSATDLVGNALASAQGFQVDVDATAVQVVTVSLPDGVREVPLGSAITVEFNKPIDPASLTPDVVQLVGGSSSVAVDVLVQGRSLFITPKLPLVRGLNHVLSVGTGLRDTLGYTLGSSWLSRFDTDQGALAYPVDLPGFETETTAVAMGDVNSDGRTDVIGISSVPFDVDHLPALFVGRGQVDGSLALAERIDLGVVDGCPPGGIAVGDVDGDGRDDVLLERRPCGFQVLRQGLDGRLGAPRFLFDGDALGVTLADLDRDGRAELLVRSWSAPLVQIWRLDAGGALVLQDTLIDPDPNGGVTDVAVGDVNGDGRVDVVLAMGDGALAVGSAPLLLVYHQNAAGDFDAPVRLFDRSTAGGARPMAIGDVNGDGRVDVVIARASRLLRFLQEPDGTLVAADPVPLREAPEVLKIADIDSDGRQDVIVTSRPDIGVLQQQADGSLGPDQPFRAALTGREHQPLAVGDLNQDGRTDVLVARQWLRQKPPALVAALRQVKGTALASAGRLRAATAVATTPRKLAQ